MCLMLIISKNYKKIWFWLFLKNQFRIFVIQIPQPSAYKSAFNNRLNKAVVTMQRPLGQLGGNFY